MRDQFRLSHQAYRDLPTEIEGFDSLAELALDLRWSETKDGQHIFEVQLCLGDIDPNAVRVELLTDGANGDIHQRVPWQT